MKVSSIFTILNNTDDKHEKRRICHNALLKAKNTNFEIETVDNLQKLANYANRISKNKYWKHTYQKRLLISACQKGFAHELSQSDLSTLQSTFSDYQDLFNTGHEEQVYNNLFDFAKIRAEIISDFQKLLEAFDETAKQKDLINTAFERNLIRTADNVQSLISPLENSHNSEALSSNQKMLLENALKYPAKYMPTIDHAILYAQWADVEDKIEVLHTILSEELFDEINESNSEKFKNTFKNITSDNSYKIESISDSDDHRTIKSKFHETHRQLSEMAKKLEEELSEKLSRSPEEGDLPSDTRSLVRTVPNLAKSLSELHYTDETVVGCLSDAIISNSSSNPHHQSEEAGSQQKHNQLTSQDDREEYKQTLSGYNNQRDLKP